MKMSDVVFFIVVNGYSVLLDLIRILIFPFLKNLSKRKGWDLSERQKVPALIRDFRNKTVVWVHAASLGEAKLLCKFLTILEQKNPADMYVVTAITKTGVEYLKKNSPSTVCAVGYLPVDTISLVSRILRHFNISRVWLLETELWPSMLWTCRKMDIPVGIINARMEENSFIRYQKFSFLLRYFFEKFDVVLAQNDIYAGRFKTLGVKDDCIHIVGNIKGHVSIKRPAIDQWEKVRYGLGLKNSDIVIACGCIHTGEGEVIKRCFDTLKENGLSCKMIIVPRYLNEVPEIIKETGAIIRLTDIKTLHNWDICIIEKMGVLDDIYMIADAAIVGGTFTDIGGHNVWDAARFGIPVFFGPDYHTQQDSCEKLIKSGVGFESHSGIELADMITNVLKTEPAKFVNAQIGFMDEINQSQSSLEQLIP